MPTTFLCQNELERIVIHIEDRECSRQRRYQRNSFQLMIAEDMESDSSTRAHSESTLKQDEQLFLNQRVSSLGC